MQLRSKNFTYSSNPFILMFELVTMSRSAFCELLGVSDDDLTILLTPIATEIPYAVKAKLIEGPLGRTKAEFLMEKYENCFINDWETAVPSKLWSSLFPELFVKYGHSFEAIDLEHALSMLANFAAKPTYFETILREFAVFADEFGMLITSFRGVSDEIAAPLRELTMRVRPMETEDSDIKNKAVLLRILEQIAHSL